MLVYSGKDRDLNMKRILAILLTVCMVVWMIPAAAFADPQQPVDLSKTTITLADPGYYVATDVDKTASKLTEAGESKAITVKDAQNSVVDSSLYTLTKQVRNDVVRVTITYNDSATAKNSNYKDFYIVDTEITDNDNYVVSADISTKPSAEIPDYTYTGQKITPALYLYKKTGDNYTRISADKYNVKWEDNINEGAAMVTFEGKNTAIGYKKATFVIKPEEGSKVDVKAEDTKKLTAAAYEGLTVKLGNVTLEKDADYTVAFKDSKDNAVTSFEQGKYYYAVVTLGSNFTGNKIIEKRFYIEKELNAKVTLSSKSFKYNGYTQTPTVTVKPDGSTYSVSSGFSVTYKDAQGRPVAYPTDAGTYKLIVTGTGSTLSGTYEDTFTITPIQLGNKATSYVDYAYISGLDSYYAYVNRAVEPEFNVIWNGRTLKKNVDYTVYYTNNNGVGTGKINVSFKGNFYGNIDGTFTIIKGKEISNATVYISPIADQAYTGYDIKPSVYVYYGGRTAATAKTLLSSYYDYDVTYTANKNAGTATVTVKGKGDYSGTATTTFRIKYDLSQASISFDRYTNVYQYTGSQIRPAVTVKVAGTAVPSSYYKVTYGENKYTGTGGSVTVAPANLIYCMPYSATKTFTINGKSQTVTPDVYVYSAKTTKSAPFKLSATATGNEGGFAYSTVDTDVVSVDSNGYVTAKACGTAVVAITTTGNKAYNPASANVKITVKPPKGKISSVVSSSRGKMKVTFEKVAAAKKGTVKYQVMYSRDRNFASGTYKIATFSSTKTEANAAAKKTVKGLLSGNRYYTKVRGYLVLDDGSRVYGKWSNVKSVRVK